MSDSRPLARWELIFLAALFVTGAVVRLWGVSKVHSWDEMVYLQNALFICCGKTNYSELSFRPPLISLLFAGVFEFRHSIYAACVATALLNALAPVFLFFAGRLCVGRIPALLASFLLAFAPFFVGVFPSGFVSDDTGNSLLTDSPALTLITLSFWLLLRAISRPSLLRFFCAGLVLALCVLMRFGSLSCVGMLLLLSLFSSERFKAATACVAGLAVGVTPYLIWSRRTFGDPFFTLKAGWIHVEGSTDPFTFFIRNAAIIFTPLAIAGLLLCIAWQTSAMLSKPWRSSENHNVHRSIKLSGRLQVYLWAWLLVEFLAFSLIAHKEPRYILPAAPPLFLLSGLGLALPVVLPTRTGRLIGATGLSICLIVTLSSLRVLLSKPFIDRETPDEELAGKLLSTTVSPKTTLYMSFNYPALAYYTNFHIHELSSIGPTLYRDMELVPPGQILVVYREAEAPSQSDISWCDQSGLFQRIAEYPSLVVYRRISSALPQAGLRTATFKRSPDVSSSPTLAAPSHARAGAR